MVTNPRIEKSIIYDDKTEDIELMYHNFGNQGKLTMHRTIKIEELQIPSYRFHSYLCFIETEFYHFFQTAGLCSKYSFALKSKSIYEDLMYLLKAIKLYSERLPNEFRDTIFGKWNYVNLAKWANDLLLNYREFERHFDISAPGAFMDVDFSKQPLTSQFAKEWAEEDALYCWEDNGCIAFKNESDEEMCTILRLDGSNCGDRIISRYGRDCVVESNKTDKMNLCGKLSEYQQFYVDTFMERVNKSDISETDQWVQSQDFNYVYVSNKGKNKKEIIGLVSNTYQGESQDINDWRDNRSNSLIERALIAICKEFAQLKENTVIEESKEDKIIEMFREYRDNVFEHCDGCDEEGDMIDFNYSKVIDILKDRTVDERRKDAEHVEYDLHKAGASKTKIKEGIIDFWKEFQLSVMKELGVEPWDYPNMDEEDAFKHKYRMLAYELYNTDDDTKVADCMQKLYTLLCAEDEILKAEIEYDEEEEYILGVANEKIRKCFKLYDEDGPIEFGYKNKSNETIILFIALIWLKKWPSLERPAFIRKLAKVCPTFFADETRIESCTVALDKLIKGYDLSLIKDSGSVKEFYNKIYAQRTKRESFFKRTVTVMNNLRDDSK